MSPLHIGNTFRKLLDHWVSGGFNNIRMTDICAETEEEWTQDYAIAEGFVLDGLYDDSGDPVFGYGSNKYQSFELHKFSCDLFAHLVAAFKAADPRAFIVQVPRDKKIFVTNATRKKTAAALADRKAKRVPVRSGTIVVRSWGLWSGCGEIEIYRASKKGHSL